MIDRKIIDELHANNHVLRGISFSLAMRNDDDSITVYKREDQPCMGELRTYGKGSVPPERASDRRPGDLRAPFPKGIPEAVGVPLKQVVYGRDIKKHNQYFEYIFGPESPWRKGLKGIEFTDDKDGKHIGIVSTDTNFDPTVFVSLFKFARYATLKGEKFDEYLKAGMDKFTAFILSSAWNGTQFYGIGGLYTPLNLKMMKDGEPHELSGGLTFRERSAYNRPKIETLFQDNTLPIPTGKTVEEIAAKIVELTK